MLRNSPQSKEIYLKTRIQKNKNFLKEKLPTHN